MELFCALLTGFFLWLFVYHWRRKSIARWRQVAGKLLCVARSTRPRRTRRALLVYFFLVLLANLYNAVTHGHLAFDSVLSIALVFAVFLMLAIPATRNIALEVCERGVFCGKLGNRMSKGILYFVPWNQIAVCQWVESGCDAASKFDDQRGRLKIEYDAVPRQQRDAITAAVCQFVVVYDHHGTRLAEPVAGHCKTNSIPWRDLDTPRFQFDLQTLLLFAVVVACAANLFALHYRSPERQAIRRLAAFSPKIDYLGREDVYELDFSACADKPTDADLVYMEPLSELVALDLSGAPITDAGLTHLKGLKGLRRLNLANTGVTEKGMEDLRRALPNASIGKRVQWSPPNVVPVAPTPPKRKGRP